MEAQRPFMLPGVDFDNGSGWLHRTLVGHWQERLEPVRLTRSRPCHKDDNARTIS